MQAKPKEFRGATTSCTGFLGIYELIIISYPPLFTVDMIVISSSSSASSVVKNSFGCCPFPLLFRAPGVYSA